MTIPFSATEVAGPPQPPAPPPSSESVRFPLSFLLENASAPIQYRALKEIAEVDTDDSRMELLTYSFPPAIKLALEQAPDGTWNDSMLSIPPARADDMRGVGTISASRRLIEFGWDRESPPLLRARRILFRLLAEDEDPAFLFELAPKGKNIPEVSERARLMLREAAACTLAQCGYENDPRLRGAAHRILDRVLGYLSSPLARKPWARVGNKQVLPAEAYPPTIYTLTLLAHMPLFRSEHATVVDWIFQHVSQPLPRQDSVQQLGSKLVPQPHYILGDMLPHRNALDADVPWALHWLELMARLGFLKRHEGWLKLYDRFIDDMDKTGVWHPHKGLAGPRSSNPFVWPTFPLEVTVHGEERWTDVTFRLGLIAKLLGRSVELV